MAEKEILYSDGNGEIYAGKYRHYKGNDYEVLYVATAPSGSVVILLSSCSENTI